MSEEPEDPAPEAKATRRCLTVSLRHPDAPTSTGQDDRQKPTGLDVRIVLVGSGGAEGDDDELIANLIQNAFSKGGTIPKSAKNPSKSSNRIVREAYGSLANVGLELVGLTTEESDGKWVSDKEIEGLGAEIAGNQRQSWRLLYFSVIATAGLVSVRRDATHYELMLGTGTMLVAFLFMQVAAAKKIFEIGAFISVCRDSTDSFVWQQIVPLIARSDSGKLGKVAQFWYLTQRIAAAYAFLILCYVYLYLPRRAGGDGGEAARGLLGEWLDPFGSCPVHMECAILAAAQIFLVGWLWATPLRKKAFEERIRSELLKGGYAAYLRWHRTDCPPEK